MKVERIDQSVISSFTSRFRTMGLSAYAARAYVTLLAHPNISASFLCNETGIPDSKIYYALNELSKKGMIIIQKGTPNTYKPIHPREAIANLKQLLVEDFNQKTRQACIHADSLAESLSPIFESADKKEEIELAYIIRGRRNIVKKMRDLMDSAKKEIVAYISEKELLDELIPSIRIVKKHVETRLAVTRELFKNAELRELAQPRMLTCSCNMVFSDMKTLITVSSWKDEIAMMTNDKGLMTMSREYYDNMQAWER